MGESGSTSCKMRRGTCLKWLGRMIEHPRWNFLFNRFLPHSTSAIGYIFFSIENPKITSNWSANHLSFIFYDISNPNFRSMPCTPLICHAKHLWILPEHHSRTDFQSMFISIQLNPAISNRAQETIYHRWRCTPCSQWLGMVSLERLTGLNQGNRENNDKNGLCTNDKKHASNPFKTITNSLPWSWP